MEAWHFVSDTLRDGRPVPPDGETLVHDGVLGLCASGLHASKRPIDALKYAPGNTLCRVKMGGQIIRDDDKIVASERTIMWRFDAGPLLLSFARRCALDVAHLWDAPAIVKEYLKTGREDIGDAAWAAAWDAARDAARDAAWAAARDAVRGAARAAARDAARDAARGAARDAARDAARAAAWDAALDKQNRRLAALIAHARRRLVIERAA